MTVSPKSEHIDETNLPRHYEDVRQWLDLVEGEVTDLPFPAHTEIAIEGFLHPGDVKAEIGRASCRERV